MSLLKPKAKRNTWSQVKRRRKFTCARYAEDGLPCDKISQPKSQAHLARIARRLVRRVARKQQEQAADYARLQRETRPAQETNISSV